MRELNDYGYMDNGELITNPRDTFINNRIYAEIDTDKTIRQILSETHPYMKKNNVEEIITNG
jgi:hypothetical protein